MRPWTNKSLGLGFLGLLLIVSGLVFYFTSPAIFHYILQKEIPLTTTSKAFEVWNDTSALPPMYFKIRFFNWTNPEELRMPGKKPNFVELGPYVFREIRQKADVVFHPENHTVSYFNRRWWFFVPELTNGSLNDRVTQLNTVAISAKHKVRYWADTLQSTLSLMLATSNVHITKTVDELLFRGYDDSLIEIGRMAAIADDIPPFDKFGWFYMRNGSTTFDGHFNMDTGTDNVANFGQVKKWNYRDTSKLFNSPCNVVEGSAGEFWPPYREKDEIVLFSGDLCRPLTYEYAQTSYHMGLEGYRYVLGEKTLGNNTKRRYPHEQAKYFEQTTTTEDFFDAEHSTETTEPPEQDPDVVNIGNCFCNGRCSPAGLMNVSSCRHGAPVFASLPYFNRGEPSLRERITGLLEPNEEYDSYIILEPTTGIPLKVSAKFQINILLEPSKTVTLYKSVPTIYFPVMWFSLEVEATEKFVNDLKKFLSLPNVCVYTGVIMILVGSLIILTMVILYLLNRQRANSIAIDKSVKQEMASAKKSELVYLDKNNTGDDVHVRNDRKLYPNSIECFNMDLQSKLNTQK